jgi:outer membrane immunogenic protein
MTLGAFMRTGHLLASTALTTSAVFVSGAAFAQPVTYNWTGWYAGLNAGGAITGLDHSVTIPGFASFPSNGSDTGFIGGFQTGYDWMFAPQWVGGLEGDINYLSARRSSSFHATLVAPAGSSGSEDVLGTQSSRVRWLSTIRARFGHVWDQNFFYATGGVAFGGVRSSVDAIVTSRNGDTTQYAGSVSSTRTGWTAGVGLERALDNRFTVKLEYLHYDLGGVDYNVTGVTTVATGTGLPRTWPAHADFNGDIIRVGFNMKLTP